MNDDVVCAARGVYAAAKGIPAQHLLAWDHADDRQRLPDAHKAAWRDVVRGIVQGRQLGIPAASLARRAWLDYVTGIGAGTYALDWDAASEAHRAAGAAVVCLVP